MAETEQVTESRRPLGKSQKTSHERKLEEKVEVLELKLRALLGEHESFEERDRKVRVILDNIKKQREAAGKNVYYWHNRLYAEPIEFRSDHDDPKLALRDYLHKIGYNYTGQGDPPSKVSRYKDRIE